MAENMVPVDIESGTILDTRYRPSSDTETYLELYRADFFGGPIPVTRSLRVRDEEVAEAYVANTGKVIIDAFEQQKIDPLDVPGILVVRHGPFQRKHGPDAHYGQLGWA